jgi:hypothetical protein
VRTRSVVATTALLTVSAALAAGVPASGARQLAPDWVSMSSHWPADQGVSVSDVAAFGKVAFAVGTTSSGKVHTPWVQVCSGRSCKAVRLPKPQGSSTTVTSIAGSAANDVWAVGWRIDSTSKEHRPVFWHRVGTTWRVFNAGADFNHNIVLTKVEVSNKSKAFALGRYRYGARKNQVTSTLYRWNGTGWKEVADLDHRTDFAAPCTGWYNRDFVDVIARPGSAILIGRCGTRHKLAILEQGDTTWTAMSGNRLPDGVAWQLGSMVGQQVWLVGTGTGGRRIIVANDAGTWKRVTTDGLRPAGVVKDLAGVFASKVTAVGWVPTGGGHHVARAWRWGAGSWHETQVPAGISRSGLSAVSADGNGPVFAIGQDLGRKPPLRAIIVHSVG